ncbi:MAG: hypothetical protein ACKESB_00425 [Candidatus Hodgkinia cicadicola]
MRLVTQGSFQISEESVLRVCPKSLKCGPTMLVKACNAVAVLRHISCRLLDITKMKRLPQQLKLVVFVCRFHHHFNFDWVSNRSPLSERNTPTLMSFTTSDAISVWAAAVMVDLGLLVLMLKILSWSICVFIQFIA